MIGICYSLQSLRPVNNVAMTMPNLYHVDEMPAELCWHMMYVNIASAVMMTNLILPQMKKQKKGAIINISSAAENIPLVFSGLYSSSKVDNYSHPETGLDIKFI